ncbi:MAG: hypothetical protein ACOCYQ_09425 [Alkalispirochaeta sp.]
MVSLNGAYRRFSEGSLSREELIEICCGFVRELFVRVFHFKPEDSYDAVAEFYPRLATLPERYNDQGSSFEAYVTVSVHYFCRTQRHTRRRRRFLELLVPEIDDVLSVAEAPVVGESYEPFLSCEEPRFLKDVACLCNTRMRDAVRRQVLIAFCKNLPLLDDSEANRYAEALRIPASFVFAVRSFIDDRNAPLIARRRYFRNQRNRHYFQMQYAQRLVREDPESPARCGAIERYRFHRRRWNHYRNRLERLKIHLSHEEIGRLLGIPKGTVDSAVARLNHRLELLRRRRYPDADADDTSRFEQRA